MQELRRALQQQAASSGADGGGATAAQQLERAFEERKAAQDSVKEMAERYSALQEKFRCDLCVGVWRVVTPNSQGAVSCRPPALLGALCGRSGPVRGLQKYLVKGDGTPLAASPGQINRHV